MDGTAPTNDRFETIALADIDEGQNYRKVFDPVKLNELAEDIRANGVTQAVTVRPREGGRFELVIGGRRFRASKIAERATIPARVRDLDDVTVLELQLSENGQRVDANPMEEAQAIDDLVTVHKRTEEEVARKLGRTVVWVQRRRALLALIEPARAMVRDGSLPVGHALTLATVDATAQTDVLARYTDREIPSLKSFAREIIYVLQMLSAATFDVADATLPGGACGGCPKRSDAQGQLDLFETASKDVGAHCLDTACWTRKGDVTWDRTKASAKRRHLTVIEDSSEVLCPDFGGNVFARHDKPYVAQAPSKDAKPVAVTRTERGRIVELYVKPDAKPAADEGGEEEDDADGNPLADDSDEEGDYPRGSPTAKRLQARVERFQKLIALVKTPAGLGIVARHALCVQIAEYGDVDLRDAAQAMGVSLPDEEDDQLAMAVPDEAAPILLALALAGGSLWEDTLKRSDNEGATERALRDAMEGKVAPPAPVVDSGREVFVNGTSRPAWKVKAIKGKHCALALGIDGNITLLGAGDRETAERRAEQTHGAEGASCVVVVSPSGAVMSSSSAAHRAYAVEGHWTVVASTDDGWVRWKRTTEEDARAIYDAQLRVAATVVVELFDPARAQVERGRGPELSDAPAAATTVTLAVKRGDWLTHRSGLRDTATASLHKRWEAEGDNRVATVERGDDVVGKVLAYCTDNNVPLHLNGKLVGSVLAAPEKPAAKKASKKTAKKGDE